MAPKLTGDPLCHHTYWVSGSAPGWLRHSTAWKSPPRAWLMSVPWSALRRCTVMPAACHCDCTSCPSLIVVGSFVVLNVNSNLPPCAALYCDTSPLALFRSNLIGGCLGSFV